MKKEIVKRNRNLHLLDYLRWLLFFSIALLLWLTFLPVVFQEIKYKWYVVQQSLNINNVDNISVKTNTIVTSSNLINPPNYDFSIVIPRINVSAPVFSNTDPFNENEFRQVLKRGVAHAKGTALPGEVGNSFIFAHSTNIFDNVSKYNAIFYLIGKLNKGDEIYIYFKNQRFNYVVYDKKVVSANSIQYLKPLREDAKTLTLSTCYPPGTTWKRLVILAILE